MRFYLISQSLVYSLQSAKNRHPRNGFVVRLFYEITCLLEAYKIIANSLRSNNAIILYYAARTSLRTALNSCRGCWMPVLSDCCLYRFLRWIVVWRDRESKSIIQICASLDLNKMFIHRIYIYNCQAITLLCILSNTKYYVVLTFFVGRVQNISLFDSKTN